LMVAFLGDGFRVQAMGYLMAIWPLLEGPTIGQIKKFSAPPLAVRGIPIATIFVASPSGLYGPWLAFSRASAC
jgi:hypothetical protein